MNESTLRAWRTVWRFLRRDMTIEAFTDHAVLDLQLQALLGSELYLEVLCVSSQDSVALPEVTEKIGALARSALASLPCRCAALSSSTWIDGAEASKWIAPLTLAAARSPSDSEAEIKGGARPWREVSYEGLAAYTCGNCGQAWLVACESSFPRPSQTAGGADMCFGRLDPMELEGITAHGTWPDRFDAISRALLARDTVAVARLLERYPSCLLSDGTFARRSWGLTPLHTAVESGHLELVRMVLDAGADIQTESYYYGSALHYAARAGRVDLARELTLRGIRLDRCDIEGCTALHLAACEGHVDMVALLLHHGADARATTEFGSTALDMAQRNGLIVVAELLSAHLARNSQGEG